MENDFFSSRELNIYLLLINSIWQEANKYIHNIGEKYGSFKLAESKTPFDPTQYNRYIRDLISRITKSPETADAQNGDKNAKRPIAPLMDIEEIFENNGAVKNEPFEINEESNEQTNLDTDENMETENDSITSDNNFHIEVDLDSTNVSDYMNSLQHFTSGFHRICKLNDELKERIKRSDEKWQTDVKALEETVRKLEAEKEQFQIETKNQIVALKKTHRQEMTELKVNHQRQIDEQKQAALKFKQECSQLIEETKKNKYCVGCAHPKPLDIYFCSMECQRGCL